MTIQKQLVITPDHKSYILYTDGNVSFTCREYDMVPVEKIINDFMARPHDTVEIGWGLLMTAIAHPDATGGVIREAGAALRQYGNAHIYTLPPKK